VIKKEKEQNVNGSDRQVVDHAVRFAKW